MTTTFSATYYDGQRSTAHSAEVQIGPFELSVQLSEGEPLTWPHAELQIVQGQLPGQRVHLRRRLEWLTFADPTVLQAIADAAQQPHLKPQQSRPSLWKHALRASLSLAVAASACYFWVLPTSVAALTPRVPTAWESMLGEAVVRQMVPVDLRVPASKETEELDRFLTLLTDEAGTPYQFRLHISRNQEVNAFAAPGGYIVVNQGLLERLESPEELLGILAHEVAHVKLRHTTEALLYNIGLQMLMTALTGDTTMGVLAWTMGSLHHSRQAEEEADREGMRLMQAARLDPQAMVRAYQMLKESLEIFEGIPTYFSTHPQTGERIAKLEAIARAAHYTPRTVNSRVAWDEIRLLSYPPSEEETTEEVVPEEESTSQYQDLDG